MMKEGLITQLTGTFGKTKVNMLVVELKEQNFALRDLIDLTFHEDKTIAFRSAWLLENLYLVEPLAYLGDLNYLLWNFKEVQNESCCRHYAKIIMHITSPKAPVEIKEKLDATDMGRVIELCFDWMIDPKILVAVKVAAGEILFNLRHCYPWISDELADQLQFLMRNGPPAIQARGRKLLAKL